MKLALFCITSLIFFTCSSPKHVNNQLNQDFYSDFSSENNRIAGDLYLDVFDEDLSNLTYDYYLTFITENESPSAKGFSNIVKQADSYFFSSQKQSFVVALYYLNEKTMICDNSDTIILDTFKVYNESEINPELSQIAQKMIRK